MIYVITPYSCAFSIWSLPDVSGVWNSFQPVLAQSRSTFSTRKQVYPCSARDHSTAVFPIPNKIKFHWSGEALKKDLITIAYHLYWGPAFETGTTKFFFSKS